MGRNKCRDCHLNNRDLLDSCWALEDCVKETTFAVFELSIFANSVGAKEIAARLSDMAMLLARSATLINQLQQERYRGRRRRTKRRRM